MVEGLDEIRSAAEALAKRDEKLRARLTEAGEEFWSAMYHVDDWSPDLRRRANEIQRSILAEGSVTETVSRMSIEEAQRTAGMLLDLFVAFEKNSERDRSEPAVDKVD